MYAWIDDCVPKQLYVLIPASTSNRCLLAPLQPTCMGHNHRWHLPWQDSNIQVLKCTALKKARWYLILPCTVDPLVVH